MQELEICSTAPFTYIPESHGCNASRPLTNRYCIGRCNSFYCPNPEKIVDNCRACIVSKYAMKMILFKCENEMEQYLWKKQQSFSPVIVKGCSAAPYSTPKNKYIYCLTKISIRAKRSISRVFSSFIVPSPFFVHCPYKGRINWAETVLIVIFGFCHCF